MKKVTGADRNIAGLKIFNLNYLIATFSWWTGHRFGMKGYGLLGIVDVVHEDARTGVLVSVLIASARLLLHRTNDTHRLNRFEVDRTLR